MRQQHLKRNTKAHYSCRAHIDIVKPQYQFSIAQACFNFEYNHGAIESVTGRIKGFSCKYPVFLKIEGVVERPLISLEKGLDASIECSSFVHLPVHEIKQFCFYERCATTPTLLADGGDVSKDIHEGEKVIVANDAQQKKLSKPADAPLIEQDSYVIYQHHATKKKHLTLLSALKSEEVDDGMVWLRPCFRGCIVSSSFNIYKGNIALKIALLS